MEHFIFLRAHNNFPPQWLYVTTNNLNCLLNFNYTLFSLTISSASSNVSLMPLLLFVPDYKRKIPLSFLNFWKVMCILLFKIVITLYMLPLQCFLSVSFLLCLFSDLLFLHCNTFVLSPPFLQACSPCFSKTPPHLRTQTPVSNKWTTFEYTCRCTREEKCTFVLCVKY